MTIHSHTNKDLEDFVRFLPTLDKDVSRLNLIETFSNPRTILLVSDDRDYSLFEWFNDSVYTGHYFFRSRGREAKKVGREMISYLFKTYPFIQMIRGLTPLEYLGARWMNKQLKFKSHGIVQTDCGPHELVMLTKEDWNE